ncbi:Uncharacterised protein [Mycobacteroides abscessus subsp. abscessus]|nr:Uncharacterised protein [Mycobacteroides abscessus subsp. abscessus]
MPLKLIKQQIRRMYNNGESNYVKPLSNYSQVCVLN